MAASVPTFIIKGCLIHKTSNSTSFKEKLEKIATDFSSLQEFKQASLEGSDCFAVKYGIKLTKTEITAIKELQKETNVNLSIEENFIQLFTKNFIAKQLKMLEKITLETLNANPLLCYALKFDDAKDFVRYYTYQAVSRSIVTSMGYFVQNLLLYSNESIHEGKNYNVGKKTKFDLVKDMDGKKIFFEIKSGFNDLDKGQIKHYYEEEIPNAENNGNEAYIGITYGKKDSETVTSSLLGTYVEEWESKTLVGKDLWKYISGKKDYHLALSKNIHNAANSVLHSADIVEKIEEKIEDLVDKFKSRYKSMDDYYNSLW